MLNAVTVTNHLGDSLTMELRNPEKSGFLITSITGIGAPSTSINITDLASTDGGYFNSARAGSRNIVFGIRFFSEDNTDIEALRQKTYRYFPTKRYVTLVFKADNRTGQISGYVESNEPNIFSKEEDCQISIVCPYPYFYDASEAGDSIIRFSNRVPAFHFRSLTPRSDAESINTIADETEHHTLNGRHRIISSRTLTYRTPIIYNGDADVGMIATFAVSGSVVNPALINYTTNEALNIKGSFISGDQIIINTERGSKSVRRLRNGTYSSIINKITRDSSWPMLWRGENLIGFRAENGIDSLALTVSHKTLFEGM